MLSYSERRNRSKEKVGETKQVNYYRIEDRPSVRSSGGTDFVSSNIRKAKKAEFKDKDFQQEKSKFVNPFASQYSHVRSKVKELIKEGPVSQKIRESGTNKIISRRQTSSRNGSSSANQNIYYVDGNNSEDEFEVKVQSISRSASASDRASSNPKRMKPGYWKGKQVYQSSNFIEDQPRRKSPPKKIIRHLPAHSNPRNSRSGSRGREDEVEIVIQDSDPEQFLPSHSEKKVFSQNSKGSGKNKVIQGRKKESDRKKEPFPIEVSRNLATTANLGFKTNSLASEESPSDKKQLKQEFYSASGKKSSTKADLQDTVQRKLKKLQIKEVFTNLYFD